MTNEGPLCTYRLRTIRPADHDRLRRFYSGLSEESRVARFLGAAPSIPDETMAHFCGPDHGHREGIVAATADGTVVGHVCIEPMDAHQAEFAVAVADGWQRRGIGRAMCLAAIGWAQRHGITQLTATMWSRNGAVIGLIRSLGLPTSFSVSGSGVVSVRIDVRHAGLRAA